MMCFCKNNKSDNYVRKTYSFCRRRNVRQYNVAMSSGFEIRTMHRKILAVIYLLEEKGKAANGDGLLKIFHGEEDEETTFFANEALFGSLLSMSSKRLKIQTRLLLQRGYLSMVYRDEDYYFTLPIKGRLIAEKFLLKPIKKKEVEKKPKKKTIIDL